MVHGIKVSKQGYNVLTTGDANISFSSQLATHSIYNIVSLNKPNTTDTATYNHNLGYVPKVWIFLDMGTYLQRIPALVDQPPWDYEEVDFYITNSSVVIQCGNSFANFNYNFKIIVFTRSPNP